MWSWPPEEMFLWNVRPSYPRTQHLRAVGGQVEHYLYWWANHLHSRMDLQNSESCSSLWKSVLLTLWKSLEVATVYIAKYHFLKSVPLSENLWIPQLADGKLAKEKLSKSAIIQETEAKTALWRGPHRFGCSCLLRMDTNQLLKECLQEKQTWKTVFVS